MNWENAMHELESWSRNSRRRASSFGIPERRRRFDSAVRLARKEIAHASNQLLVFTPSDWDDSEDWLLSSDQWRYLIKF
jgi:hypothetical protein